MRIALRLLLWLVAAVALGGLAFTTAWPPDCAYDANCGIGSLWAVVAAVLAFIVIGVVALCTEVLLHLRGPRRTTRRLRSEGRQA